MNDSPLRYPPEACAFEKAPDGPTASVSFPANSPTHVTVLRSPVEKAFFRVNFRAVLEEYGVTLLKTPRVALNARDDLLALRTRILTSYRLMVPYYLSFPSVPLFLA